MPSCSIDLAIAKKVINKLNLNKDLFYYGNLIPDVDKNALIGRDKAHYDNHNIPFLNCPKEYMIDVDLFLKDYKEKLSNPLILGYYCHLLTDNFYNNEIYSNIWVQDSKHNIIGIKLKNGKILNIDKEDKIEEKEKNILSSIINTTVSNSPIAKIAKAVVTVASNIFLGAKGYDVSRNMFNKSMYNPSGNISKNTQKQIINKSKNSPQVKSAIKTCVTNNSNSNSFSNCLGYNDAEMTGDLFYSIQHVDIYVSGKKINDNTWDVTINMSDIYDFTEFRSGLSFANLANNLGFVMEQTGLLKSYKWSVSYKIEYTE